MHNPQLLTTSSQLQAHKQFLDNSDLQEFPSHYNVQSKDLKSHLILKRFIYNQQHLLAIIALHDTKGGRGLRLKCRRREPEEMVRKQGMKTRHVSSESRALLLTGSQEKTPCLGSTGRVGRAMPGHQQCK